MKEYLIEIIKKELINLNVDFNDVEIEKPKIKQNGDYSTNIALKIAKNLKENPYDIALKIVKDIKDPKIERIEAIKPGFINIFVKKDYLFSNLEEIIKLNKNYGKNNLGNNQKVNIEFVSANPTGILHLGNARGGAYGDSLARILSFSGYNVTKEYYLNDAGNQINKLALSIKSRYYEECGKRLEMPEDGYFGKEIIDLAKNIYKDNKEECLNKELDYFKEQGINFLIKRIINILHLYRIDYDIITSEKDIRQKYPLDEIINKLGDYTYQKDGAIWFKCSSLEDDKDHVLVKEDGEYTYLLPDIAYHLDKYNRGYDKMIDVLGTDHHGYINRLKSSIKALGNDPSKLEVKLLQLVRFVNGDEVVKMSKRSGNSVSLEELINEVGVNAARYYFIKTSLDTQMDFDLKLAKEKSNENSVYYICYAYARICSILNNKEVYNIHEYKYLDVRSYDLLEKLYDFPEVVVASAKKELPHLIANYVYELASLFHTYYGEVKIISENVESMNENLNLILAAKIVLENSLNLIGVIPPEKM